MKADYYDNVRRDLFPFLPGEKDLRVLELGCASGQTGAELKRIGVARRVVGIEKFPEAASQAIERLDAVLVGDLDLLSPPDEKFDLIFCADVLEHLADPWSVMSSFVRCLEPGGWLLTSTPNLRYWRILYDLSVRGRFEYTDSGLMDRTHLRWFTQNSIVALHEQLGLTVELVGYPEVSGKRRLLDLATRGLFRDVLGGQHVVRSRKIE